MVQLANRDDRQDRKVAALMTAESVIVGLMFAYAPTVNSTLVFWIKEGGSPVTTVWAGLGIYVLILTGFRSIYLLFKSIDTVDPSNRNYRAGYYLFLAVIFGSSTYVLSNVISILHYAQCNAAVGVPQWLMWAPVPPFSLWMLLVYVYPSCLTEWLRRRVECLRRQVKWQVLLGGLVCAIATLCLLTIMFCLL